MCFEFSVMSLLVFITHMVKEHPLWSSLLSLTSALCVHSPNLLAELLL